MRRHNTKSLNAISGDWSAFWLGHCLVQLSLDAAMWGFLLGCTFGPDNFIPWPLWPVFLMVLLMVQLLWLAHYGCNYAEYVDYYAPFKIIFVGGFVNAAAAFVLLTIGVYMNSSERPERVLEYVVLYPIAQWPIYCNYVFAWWSWR